MIVWRMESFEANQWQNNSQNDFVLDLCPFHFGVITSCVLCRVQLKQKKKQVVVLCRSGRKCKFQYILLHAAHSGLAIHVMHSIGQTLSVLHTQQCSAQRILIKTTPKGFVTSRTCTKCTVVLPHGPG